MVTELSQVGGTATLGELTYDPLLEGKPMENVTHVAKDMVGNGAQKPIQVPHPPSHKANIKRIAVIKPICKKRMNKGGRSTRG